MISIWHFHQWWTSTCLYLWHWINILRITSLYSNRWRHCSMKISDFNPSFDWNEFMMAHTIELGPNMNSIHTDKEYITFTKLSQDNIYNSINLWCLQCQYPLLLQTLYFLCIPLDINIRSITIIVAMILDANT